MGTQAASAYLFLIFVVVINIPEHSATSCKYKVIRPSSSYDGIITSPGYPSTYSSDLCKIWVFYGWSGLQVTIRFLDVDIPSFSDECLNDLLRIGPLNEQTYCSSIYRKNFEPYTAEFNSTDYLLYMVFNTTRFGTKGRGFKIAFQFWEFGGMPSLTTTTVATTTSAFLNLNEGLRSNELSCHFFPTEDTGYIETDKTVLECLTTTGKATWQISYPSIGNTNFKCQIYFDECTVPYPDRLIIYDGYSNENKIIGEYSEELCPNFLISTTGSLFLEYARKDTATLPRLKLTFMKIIANGGDRVPTEDTTMPIQYITTETPPYRYIPPKNPFNHYYSDCAFHLSNNSGEINSADIASLVQRSGFCTWLLHFEATDGQVVSYTLNFEKFHLSAESQFVVYDGVDMTARVLGSYLPLAPSLSLLSSQSSVFIYFNPGININLVGVSDVFTVKYQANIQCLGDYLPCGYEELACYRNSDRCDNIWNCPLHGGDERGCFIDCPQEFSCGFTTSVCYSEEERCNGKAFCQDNLDELNCNKAQCSSDKSLFLCKSGHCIYENLRCDQVKDCTDNSDEDNCPFLLPTRLIIAAVGSSLTCALILVLFMGCVCKVYHLRNHRLHESQHQETPLTRHLLEMLRQRAPPPPYHEAMLTSRPYSEADFDRSEQQEGLGLINTGFQDDIIFPSSSEQTEVSQDSEHTEDQTENYEASVFRNIPGRMIEVGTLSLFSESFENDSPYWHTDDHDLQADESELPPYSETDPSSITGSYHGIYRDENYHEDSRQRSYRSVVYASDSSHAGSARELLIQMEMMPSDGAENSASAQTTTLLADVPDSRKSVPERHRVELTSGDSSHTRILSSSRLFIDSSRDKGMDSESGEIRENDEIRESDEIREAGDISDVDSDSECILAEDNVSDNNSESDTCILAHE